MINPRPHRFLVEPFRWEPGDPLAAEHKSITELTTQVLASGWQTYKPLELDNIPALEKVFAADPETSARWVLAFIIHVSHWEKFQKKILALAKNQSERWNLHSAPEYEAVWSPRQVSAQALRRLLRRKLPLQAEHLIQLADWMTAAYQLSDFFYPLKGLIKAIENFGPIDPGQTALRASLARLANVLQKSTDKEHPKLVHQIDLALSHGIEKKPEPPRALPGPGESSLPDPAIPQPAGSAQSLVQLKEFLGILPADETPVTEIGFDHFPLRADSPFREEHDLINQLLATVIERPHYEQPNLSATEPGRAVLARDDRGREKFLLACAERAANSHFVPGGGLGDHRCWQSQGAIAGILNLLLLRPFTLERTALFDLLLYLSALSDYRWSQATAKFELWLSQIEAAAAAAPLSGGERHVLYRLRSQCIRSCAFGHLADWALRLDQLLRDGLFLALIPGEAWSDAVNSDLSKLSAPALAQWLALLQHAATANGSRPSAKWLKTANELVRAIGAPAFAAALQRWFPLVNSPRTVRLLGGSWTGQVNTDYVIHEENATCLRGLLWMCPAFASPDLVRLVGALTVSCYRKIPGIGPRAVKAANAGVYVLSQINDPLAVGHLALLKVKVKFGSAQKEIEKAFNLAAERSGLPRSEIEEMSVPAYGLTDVGICEETFGEFTARLSINGINTELSWIKPDGKLTHAVPAAVKKNYKEDFKELQAAAKDIQAMLPAQRERIDSLFLQQKNWSLPLWRERYLNHPLVGTLARRLLWEFKHGEHSVTAIWFQGRLVDLDLKPVELPDSQTSVQLWHPIGKNTDEIIAWRSWLDSQQIQQPFKQAHREIYLLTDAELNTRLYSNRYAAHILKQHQFNALCALRGWKNKLRLLVDAEYPPATLYLPLWNLRAEFWIEGLGEDYGTDTNDSGVYHYLSTDQVRFYRSDAPQRMAHAGGGGYLPDRLNPLAEPLPLSEIPPLVFSEVMRDVDLFVGVASVGNDPAWLDGGRQGRYQDYWREYSFGELNASARTRREVLQRLVPRLKIADRCSFQEKFIVVKGTFRTYKIHLGSGNILMEPTDQYLCIVPKAGETGKESVLLPFEGDRTLSVILSKAFLLANDSKITDQTILNQINRK